MSDASGDGPRCEKCKTRLEVVQAKAPGSDHTATYAACVTCSFFGVERTPEHEAEIEARQPKGKA